MSAALIVAALYALHQDVWFWREARPLVFGVLPIGLFYHAAYTVAVSLAPEPDVLMKRVQRSDDERRRHVRYTTRG